MKSVSVYSASRNFGIMDIVHPVTLLLLLGLVGCKNKNASVMAIKPDRLDMLLHKYHVAETVAATHVKDRILIATPESIVWFREPTVYPISSTKPVIPQAIIYAFSPDSYLGAVRCEGGRTHPPQASLLADGSICLISYSYMRGAQSHAEVNIIRRGILKLVLRIPVDAFVFKNADNVTLSHLRASVAPDGTDLLMLFRQDWKRSAFWKDAVSTSASVYAFWEEADGKFNLITEKQPGFYKSAPQTMQWNVDQIISPATEDVLRGMIGKSLEQVMREAPDFLFRSQRGWLLDWFKKTNSHGNFEIIITGRGGLVHLKFKSNILSKVVRQSTSTTSMGAEKGTENGGGRRGREQSRSAR